MTLVAKLKHIHAIRKAASSLGIKQLFAFWLLAISLSFWGCSKSEPEVLSFGGQTMGTSYFVLYRPGESETADKQTLQSKVDALLESIEQSMSTYRPDSELSKLNKGIVGEWQSLSPELAHVLASAVRVSSASEGAFDVTVGPLVDLWGFGPDYSLEVKPKDAVIKQVLRNEVGIQYLDFDEKGKRLKKNKALRLDLSAIAKGYGVDRIAELLSESGIDHYLVEIGGELRASGAKAKGKPWRVAIEKPVRDTLALEREIEDVLALKDVAIASSGDYRNFFKEDGKLYSHTIDPKTGWPVSHSLSSVSVLHDSCMQADALATSFMVMGPEKTLEYAKRHDLAVLLMVREGDGIRKLLSPKMEGFVTELKAR